MKANFEPFWLTDETILWLGFSGKDYTLYAASTDSNVINHSQKINRTDWEHALSNMIMSLFGSTMTLLFMLFAFILPFAFYLVTYYFNARFIEHHSQRAAFIMMILYVTSQLIFFTKGLSMKSFYHAPAYLSFQGSLIILSLLMAVLTWFIWRTVKDEEWGIIGNFAYFAVVNALLIMFSLGPYIL
jgi:predicted neutral ceramidase superfamily lipid hydrolase